MSAQPRPGVELYDDERHAALLGQVYDSLVLLQISHPDLAEGVRSLADMIRYVRAQLLKRVPEGVDHGQAVGE